MQKYQAPKLTRYGKAENFIQAGSVALQSGDLTGDGTADTAFDTNSDGIADVVVGGASGGQTSVAFQFNATADSGENADFYDSDGDGLADFAIADLNNTPTLQRITSQSINSNTFNDYVTLADTGLFYSANIAANTELSNEADWDDPARD